MLLETIPATRWSYGLLLPPCSLVVYYLTCWAVAGWGPHRGTVVAQYQPPEGISPAGARFLRTTGTDGRSVAAAIADMAARKCVSITVQSGGYEVTRLVSDSDAAKALPPEEKDVFSVMFYSGASMTLDPKATGHSTLADHLDRAIRKEFGDKYFSSHYGLVLVGVLGGFFSALVVAATIPSRDRFGTMFLTLWTMLAGNVLGLIFWLSFVSMWKSAMRGLAGWKQPLQGLLVFGLFTGGLVFVAGLMSKESSPAYALMVAAIIFVTVMCAPLLSSYTDIGRKTLDEIEGFRQFLVRVEEDQLARLNTPNATPEFMNQFLPYAVALDVREAWGDRFCDDFQATETVR